MKIERVYREVLYKLIDAESENRFTQLALARACSISLSTVNYALKPLERMNALEKRAKGFRVIAPKKILLYWASIRNPLREIVFEAYVNESIEDIEMKLPQKIVFTAYSGFKFRFRKIPSDYSEVIVYGEPEPIKDRFRIGERRRPNLIVMKLDEHLSKFGSIAPTAQIFVDLWNLDTWYANEFVKKLEEIIDGVLARHSY